MGTRTSEQDRQDRKAAQLRKKKGKGRREEKPEFLQGKSLSAIGAANKLRAARLQEKENEVADLVDTAKSTIEHIGVVSLKSDMPHFVRVLRALKDIYRGTQIHWESVDGGINFGKRH